jgi:hypothetical protein
MTFRRPFALIVQSMFVARWQIDARFGHKQAVIDLMHRWLKEIGSKAGTDKMDVKLLTGSVGARGHDRGQSYG